MLAAAAGCGFATAMVAAEVKRHRKVVLSVAAVPVPADAAGLARGASLYKSRGCTDCHGQHAAGRR